jgi:hypothetical protein
MLHRSGLPEASNARGVVDELIEDCNGDVRGIVGSLFVINEQLETELNRLHTVINNGGAEQADPRRATI